MLRPETIARLQRLGKQLAAGQKGRARNFSTPGEQTHESADYRIDSVPAKRDRGLDAGEPVDTSCGSHLLVRKPLRDLWETAGDFVDNWREKNAKNVSREKDDAYREFLRWFPQHTVFLDLETCGFAGSPVFLAGILHWIDGELCLSQYWARNYAEEGPMMQSLREELASQKVMVTFNGKSFDWPQVRDRCVLHTGSVDGDLPEFVQVDLLHMARRRWKKMLPNCKLQTIETYIFGRQRHGDIPGGDIPLVYEHYVRTGATRDANRILHHNALDLITLLQMALCIRD